MTAPGSSPGTPAQRVVYKAIHRPLTICGVERRLFFMAIGMGAIAFNLFYSLVCGVLVGTGLYLFGRWATRTDQQMLRIIMASARCRARYDAAKHVPHYIEVERC